MTLTDGGAEGKGGYAVDSEVKLKHTYPTEKFELKLTPSKVKIEKAFNPDSMNSATSAGSFLGRLEQKVGKGKPDVTAGLTYALPSFHQDAGAWLEGNLTYKDCKEWTGDASALLSIRNQFFVGSQIKGHLQTKKAQEITGVAAVAFDTNFVYLHANCLEHIIRFGFTTPQIQYIGKLAAEAKVRLNEKGPIEDKTSGLVAFDYPINPDTKLKLKFDITKKVFAHFSFIHQINRNLKLTFTDACNPAGFFRNSEKEQYRLGLAFEANF